MPDKDPIEVLQTENKSIEGLSYEDQQLLKQYELEQSEEELYMREFPDYTGLIHQ